MNNFLNSIVPGIKFDLRYGSNRQCEGSPAAVDYKYIIWVNRETFPKFTSEEQKTIILHEVGHILAGETKGVVDSELYAQIMAISIAKKNGWKKLHKSLEDMIMQEWRNEFKWNDKKGAFRRYILAGRKYKCLKEKNRLYSLSTR